MQHSFDRAVEELEERVKERVAAQHGTGAEFTLADAQFLIARAHGFESWAELVHHIEPAPNQDATGRKFETAADAVVSGDLATLESLLRANPELIRARSPRLHRVTLLHYVAANGVEWSSVWIPPRETATA